MSRFLRVALTITTLLTLGGSAYAQEGANPPQRKYPPLPVQARAHQSHDEWFNDVSKKIADGTARTQERRAWYEMRKRYYPFTPDARPPQNWRANAMQQADRLDYRAVMADRGRAAARGTAAITPMAAADYTWTQVGPDVPWGQGQPPSGSPNTDYGAGRATAIWVNPNDSRDVLVGFADGGVWKSTNVNKTENNATWTPLSDFVPSLSVGDVVAQVSAVDGNRLGPNTTIWIATGEGNFGGGDVQGVGVLKSTDGGATWQLKQIPWQVAGDGTSMYDRTSIRRIAIDPRKPADMWIAADSGVYRSNDAGETWRLVQTLPYWKKHAGDCWYVYVTDLLIDDQTPAAGQPSHIYVANGRVSNAGCSTVSRQDNAIFRTKDDGATWVNISVANANCPGTVAGTSNRGYSCVGSGFAASGLTNATTVSGTVGRISLAHSAGNKKKIYAMIQNTSTSGSLGIWSTDDASAAAVTWTARSTTNYCGQQCWYDMVGAVNPANDTQLIVGGLQAYISGNNGGTISQTSSWTGWGTTTYAHADHHRMIWVDATTVYLVTDGGFNVGNVTGTGANGVSWINQTYGMGTGTLQAYGMGQSATHPNRMHVGVQDNGQPKVVLDGSNNITQWWEIRGGDGGFSATNRTNDAIAYNEYVYAGIYRATNANYTNTTAWNWACQNSATSRLGGCTTCNGSCVPDDATQFIAPLTLDYNNQSVLYASSNKVYRKLDAGGWISYSPFLTVANATYATANPGDGWTILWAHSAQNNGAAGRIWVTTENGRVWTSSNANCGTADCATWSDVTKAPLPNRAFSWITTHPTNGQWAILTVLGWNSGHVYRTLDGGTTWTDISGALPNEPFNTAVVDPNSPNRVLVGSDFGVYVWEDAWNSSATPDWLRINNGALPYQKVYELQWSPAASGKLRAATHGRGIWELTIAPGAGCGGSVPAAPTGLSVAASSGQVTLSWNPVSGATSYKIYRVDGESCPTTSSGRVVAAGVTATSFTDLTSCTGNYSYYVVAMNAGNCESQRSACITATMPAAVAPTGLAAVTGGPGEISLSWNSVAGAATYEVWRQDNTACPATSPTQIASNVSATSFLDTGLVNGTNYAYSVRVQSSCPSAPFSTCVTAQPQACVPPSAPTNVSAVADAENRITVTWSAVAGATNYKVLRSGGVCPGGTFTEIAAGITGTSYQDTTVVGPNAYSYKVIAWKACDSAPSSCSHAYAYQTCLTAPSFAGLSSAAADAGTTCGVDLSWSAGTSSCGGTLSYNIYRSQTNGFTPASSNRIASGVSGTSFTDTAGLAPSNTYYYVVRAVDTANNVEENNTVQRTVATGGSCSGAPMAVQLFTVSTTGTSANGKNVIQWINPQTGTIGSTVTINFRTDTYPTGPNDPLASDVVRNRPLTFGAVDSVEHTGISLSTTYYYAIWVRY